MHRLTVASHFQIPALECMVPLTAGRKTGNNCCWRKPTRKILNPPGRFPATTVDPNAFWDSTAAAKITTLAAKVQSPGAKVGDSRNGILVPTAIMGLVDICERELVFDHVWKGADCVCCKDSKCGVGQIP